MWRTLSIERITCRDLVYQCGEPAAVSTMRGNMNPALTAQLGAISTIQAELRRRMEEIEDRIARVGRLARQEVPRQTESAPVAVPVQLPEARPAPPPTPVPQRPPPVTAPAPPAVPGEPVAKDHALE